MTGNNKYKIIKKRRQEKDELKQILVPQGKQRNNIKKTLKISQNIKKNYDIKTGLNKNNKNRN